MISIICPIYNEEKFIAKCIDSILEQDFPQNQLEIILIDGCSTDNTRAIISKYVDKYPNILLLNNPNRVVPYALNIGIKVAKGDVVVRIDAHCKYPNNYLSTLYKYLFELNADNVGGVWKTLPANNSSMAIAIAIASSHPFGVGGSKHKIGTSDIIETDTVPFGCYKKEVFNKIGLFDIDLVRNQDDEFNARLINNGGKIFLIPNLVIEYTARDSFAKMCKMYYQYGLYKPLVNKKLGKPATIRQFVPPMFVAALFCGLILSFVSKIFLWLYLSFLILHFAIGFFVGVKNCINTKRISMLFLMPWVFFNVHLSYGVGYFIGLFKVLFNRRFSVKSNR